MNVFLIHHRSSHHANNSGYGRLMDYLDAKVVYGTTRFPYKIAKVLAGFHYQSLGNYNVGSVLKGIELYQFLKKDKGQKNIVHFLNGERDIRHLDFFKRKFPNTTFCATFHKHPEVLKKTIPNPTALRKLDGAIAVGTNQVEFLKDWLQLEKVVYIPHGVDTGFFVPDESLKKQNTLLFVGQHLRDFDILNYCIPKIADAIQGVEVHIVIHPAYVKKIVPHSCSTLHTGIQDSEFRKLYNEATLLFLPLVEVTACNSILEGLACGMPIVTTAVGGNPDYLEGTQNILVPPDDNSMYVDAVISLLKDPDQLVATAQSSREKALEYDWNVVAEKIHEFYKWII